MSLSSLALFCPSVSHAEDTPQTDGQAEASVQRFDVLEYRVSGNSVLALEDVERTLYPHLGSGKVFTDVEQARRALEQRYRDAGYPAVMVDIPEQSVAGGVVWLRVNESRISALRITGSRYYSPKQLAAELPSLHEGNRLQLSAVQDDINRASAAFPERNLVPVLRPGITPGTVEMEMKVRDQLPLHGGIEINDRYGENTSRWRANASLGYSNLWQRGHAFTLQYQTAPQETDEVQVWSGTYLWRQSDHPSLFAIYAVDSESNTAALGDLSVIGNGNIYGLRWINPSRDSDSRSRSVTLGIDYKDFDENIILQGADRLTTPISYVSFSAAFNSTQRQDEAMISFNAASVFGVRGLGNSAEEFENKRYLAQPNFLYLRAGIERLQPLWFGTRLQVSFDGQLANSPLISNEQYSAGGSDTVRGYHESQQLGDDGARASVELHTPSLLGNWSAPNREFYALMFWDGAALHLQEALPEQDTRSELSSAGLGLRLRHAPHWDARLDWAKVFKEAGSVKDGDSRWHLFFNYGF